MGRSHHVFDLIIIGGGSAGLAALREARKYSSNVLLIQDDPEGNTCARTGCMPSKSLIHAATLFHARHKMEDAGICGAQKISADIPAILQRVREKRDAFVASVRSGMKQQEQCIIKGRARLHTPTSVRVGSLLLHTKATVIATGSSPYVSREFQEFEDKVFTTDTLFEQNTLPKRMAVIGMGSVGLELAQALARLGIEVTAVERNGHLGGVADMDINEEILRALQKEMRVWMGCKLGIKRKGQALTLTHKDEKTVVDALLVTTGRKPNLSTLGLKRLGVPLDSAGVPHFNRYTMQIHGFPLYIAGDATDERAVLHEAVDEGERAAYHALTGNQEFRHRKVLMTIVFTHPTIAIIGDSSYAMRNNGIVVGEASFTDQGRAVVENEAQGKIRIAANKQDGTLRGCEMMAPHGEHLAHLIAFGLEQKMTAQEMLSMPYYHPSFEEGLKTALKQICKAL